MLEIDLPERWLREADSITRITQFLGGNSTEDTVNYTTSGWGDSDDETDPYVMAPLASGLYWGIVLITLSLWGAWSIYKEYQNRFQRLNRVGSSEHRSKEEMEKQKEDWIKYFEKSGRQMTVVESEHIIRHEPDLEDQCCPSSCSSASSEPEALSDNDDEAAAGFLLLPNRETTNSNTPRVPNCCIVCMEPYLDGEVIVWSSDLDCRHVFHRDCFVGYLLGHRGNDQPCPTCRREFCCEATSQTKPSGS